MVNAGFINTPEADAISEEMAVCWENMTEEEVDRFHAKYLS
jgi:hypothetical protein